MAFVAALKAAPERGNSKLGQDKAALALG